MPVSHYSVVADMQTVTPKADGMTTFVLDIGLLVICWPTVIGRFVFRINKGTIGLDDWLMGIGLVSYSGLAWIAMVAKS